MIIKIIPENEAEARKHPAVEFGGVKEFFIAGSTDTSEFHEWEGAYPYLMDTLSHFHDVIFEEKINRNAAQRAAVATVTLKNPDGTEVPQRQYPIEPSPFVVKHEGQIPVNVPLHVVHATPSIRAAFERATGFQAVKASELGQDGLDNVIAHVNDRFNGNTDEQANPME